MVSVPDLTDMVESTPSEKTNQLAIPYSRLQKIIANSEPHIKDMLLNDLNSLISKYEGSENIPSYNPLVAKATREKAKVSQVALLRILGVKRTYHAVLSNYETGKVKPTKGIFVVRYFEWLKEKGYDVTDTLKNI